MDGLPTIHELNCLMAPRLAAPVRPPTADIGLLRPPKQRGIIWREQHLRRGRVGRDRQECQWNGLEISSVTLHIIYCTDK